MRIWTFALAGVLAVAVSVPASAAKKKTRAAPSVEMYEKCEARAHAQGLDHTQNGHIGFVRQCMGYRPGSRPAG
jgi:hypothetical protein